MKTKQHNMNKSRPTQNTTMGLKSEDQRTEKQIRRYLEAFRNLADKDPKGFTSLAPELLKRSVYQKNDPVFYNKLSVWLEEDWVWTPFSDIIPKKLELHSNKNVKPVDVKNLSPAFAELISRFSDKFSGDYSRWDTAIKDQFVVLGILAIEGKQGVRQGKLVHHLGLKKGQRNQGSNALRAAKIALSRQSKDLPISMFKDAVGNGDERIHAFDDANLADCVARFILNHDASVLLPSPFMKYE